MVGDVPDSPTQERGLVVRAPSRRLVEAGVAVAGELVRPEEDVGEVEVPRARPARADLDVRCGGDEADGARVVRVVEREAGPEQLVRQVDAGATEGGDDERVLAAEVEVAAEDDRRRVASRRSSHEVAG